MITGAKSSVRTELTAQLEEQGYIESILSTLKDQHTPMPVKVAGVEVLKVCQSHCLIAHTFPNYFNTNVAQQQLVCLCVVAIMVTAGDDARR